MQIITASITLNNLSMLSGFILFRIRVPIRPPEMPQNAIRISIGTENSGTVTVAICHMSEDSCEHIIINSEYAAADFVPNENSTHKNIIFIGPPPIPKNDENRPSSSPAAAAIGKLRTRSVGILLRNTE